MTTRASVDFRFWPKHGKPFIWKGQAWIKVDANHAVPDADRGAEPEFVPSHEQVFFTAPEVTPTPRQFTADEIEQMAMVCEFHGAVIPTSPKTEPDQPEAPPAGE